VRVALAVEGWRVIGAKDRAALEAVKRASWAQLLIKCARLVNERALASLATPAQGPRIRAAHTALFPHVDLEGTRLTVLARRLGISKQAVGQLVDELETIGVFVRVPDPSDRRAKLIQFTDRAGATILDGMAKLREIEEELAAVIGRGRAGQLYEALLALHDALVHELGPATAEERGGVDRGAKGEWGWTSSPRAEGERGDD
jgi:DNA-binding MarR family transcriptional regulator